MCYIVLWETYIIYGIISVNQEPVRNQFVIKPVPECPELTNDRFLLNNYT